MKLFKRLEKKYWWSILAVFSCIALVFLIPNVANAAWDNVVASFVGALVSIVIWILGKLLVGLIFLVVWVAQYNQFISSPAVAIGWTIVRDVCNMFFILILLVIAFATILNVEKYSWKHLLPKLLIMAVLINFSKLICGLIIDAAQVVMLTFVNGFRDIAGGNFGSMFGINELLNISGQSGEVQLLSVAGTYILAVLYVLISLVVITVILFVLVIRIVMLWILVVLSPLAYLLSSTPSTEAYAKDWWKQFTNNVVAGPILAFFIWLSFATMQNNTAEGLFGPKPNEGSDSEYYSTISTQAERAVPTAGLATAGTPEGMLKFVISIGLLIGGLMITKQIGGAVGDIAGKGIGAISKGANAVKSFGVKTAKNVGTNTGRLAAQTSLRAAGASSRGVGNWVSKKTGGKYGESLQKSGAFLHSWGADIQKTRKEAKVKKRKATLEKLGMKEGTMNLGKEALNTPLGRSIKGGLTMGTGGLMMLNPLTAGVGTALMWAGAAHMGGALSSKYIGKQVQQLAYVRQRSKNIKGATSALKGVDKDKEKMKKYRLMNEVTDPLNKDIENRTKKKERDLRAVEDQLQVDVRNAKNTNAPQADIDKLYRDAEQKRVNITADADLDIQRLNDKLKIKSKNAKLRIDAEVDTHYQPVIDNLERFKKQNELSRKRDYRVGQQERTRDYELAEVERKRKTKLDQVKDQYKNGPANLRDQELAKENANFDAERAAISKKHNDWIDEYKKRTVTLGKVPNTTIDSRIPKGIHKAGKGMENIQFNRLTVEAMKSGAKEFETARTTVDNLAENDVLDFDTSVWSSPNGINSQQEKTLSLLGNGSKDSNASLQNIIFTLRHFDANNKGHKKKLEAIMRGVAHIKSKKPETSSAYAALISKLEQLHPDGTKVDKYTPKK